MNTIKELMEELKKSEDLFKWYEGQSSYYTLERISSLVNEILQQEPEPKIRKRVINIEKACYKYMPPMTTLELNCRAASAAWRDPRSSHVNY